MPARNLLDPRWHWARQALERVFAELGPDEQMVAICVVSYVKDEDAVITTAVLNAEWDKDGQETVARTMAKDPTLLRDWARIGEDPRNISLVPEDPPVSP